jgi:SAM-dependent methyltransferase
VLTSSRYQFLEDYARIRAAEGRASTSGDYYRALPFADLTGRNTAQWRIRARSFRYFVRRILPPKPCAILDLGAGNCWFSYRLAEMGHCPVAVDIFSDAEDGLRAARHYSVRFPRVEAEFDSLPFPPGRFDLAVFNSSIHYSQDYRRTLAEALRCLRPGGQVVIVDSPIYFEREHGERMRAERHASFERQYGFASNALESIEFFDPEMLDQLSRDLSLTWTIYRPWYGWRWYLRPFIARLRGRRPPSHFWILAGRATGERGGRSREQWRRHEIDSRNLLRV